MASEGGVLVVLEAADGALNQVSLELLGAGRTLADALGNELSAVLVGSGVSSLAADAGAYGADRVLPADDARLSEYVGDSYVQVAAHAVKLASPRLVLIGQTESGRELAPRLAFRLQAGITTDCTDIRVEDGAIVMTKPVYGGNAVADYIHSSPLQVATLRPRAFVAAERQDGRSAQVETLDPAFDEAKLHTRLVETVREVATEGPRLRDARIVVSGGRGLGGPENWHYVEELAEVLGAAVGATRAVTDAGWVPPSLQVGLTGVTISPDLYVTVGISGAVQHIAGVSGAKNVVAINRDADANIFRHARFGVVGDYKQILPAFTAKVKELRG
jgi:electron transfer flavoprotein alpha subunit